ncbi:hypothetical protein V6Z12_D10G124600 [Gossypium hirsutum]
MYSTATSGREIELLASMYSTVTSGREVELLASMYSTATSGREVKLPASMYSTGSRITGFNILHGNHRKVKSAIFDLLHYCLERQDLLSSTCSPVSEGGEVGVFDLLHCRCRKLASPKKHLTGLPQL